MKKQLREVKYFLINILYFIPMLSYKKNSYKIYSDKDTVNKISNEGYSLCRYGDGEFKWMLGIKQNSFQNDNDILRKKLLEIFEKNDAKKILIGIPSSLNTFEGMTNTAKGYWKKFISKNHIELEKIIPKNLIYSEANITRPYIDYKQKDTVVMKKKFDNIKRIWNKRNIIIVEGKYSRLGVTNDLFDNCSSIKRIICPPTNAFDKYNEIFESIIDNYSENDLILISLGPTATILAYELCKKGIQSIDIGHIDIEYEWFLSGAKTKTVITGKYVNEVKSLDKIADVKDDEYEKQIVCKILGDENYVES